MIMKTDTRNKSMPAGQRSLAVLLPALLACGMAMGQYVPPDRYGDAHTGATVLRQNKGQVHDTEGNLRPDVIASFEGSPVGIYLRDSSRVSFTYSMMYQDSMVADTVHRVDMQVGKAAGPLVIGIPVTPASKPVKPGLLLPAPGMSNYLAAATSAIWPGAPTWAAPVLTSSPPWRPTRKAMPMSAGIHSPPTSLCNRGTSIILRSTNSQQVTTMLSS